MMEMKLNQTNISYEAYGEGIPVICVHGFPEDHRAMAYCVEPVFNGIPGYRRIYPDLPGMGRSPVSPGIHNADQMLEVLQHFISRITEGQPYLLVGQSYGGYLSLGLAHQFPSHIDGIFLLCPCTVARRSERRLPEREAVIMQEPQLAEDDSPEDYRDFLDMAAIVSEEVWNRYKAEILPGLKIADPVFTKQYQEQGYAFSFEKSLSCQTYEKPVTILTGRQDDCVGYEDAFRLLKAFPRATFTVEALAGHNLQLEAAATFETHFRRWLEQTGF